MMFAKDNLEHKKECGIFAKVEIPASTPILEFKGDVVDKKENNNYLQIATNKYLTEGGAEDDYLNHSCNPNCSVFIVGHRAFLISLYVIKPGTQLTFDYSTTSTEQPEEWKMNCNCNDYNCRKVISGYSSLSDAKRKEYEQMEMVPQYVKDSVK